ncbi:MAG: thiamine-phosphate kinase [Phycisphaeraceae bacterium]
MHEENLLQHVYATSGALAGAVTIPPGDDMGALRIGDEQVLVTVDQLADGLHVTLDNTPLEKVARKAITRNLSDVAAMAALPRGAVVAAALPRDFGEPRATALFDAMRDVAGRYDCPLFGGDIAMWDQPLMLTVTILAEPAGIEPVLRQGARVGDAVYVSGVLGGSLESVDGHAHHLDFEPRIELSRKLAGSDNTRPHCMIDLSDGLGRDLARLCRASNVSAIIEAEQLPISRAAQQAAQRSGEPAWHHAVSDGEDYELLFTAPPDAIPATIDGVSLTRIGTIERADPQPTAHLRLPDGSTIDLSELGWEHHG